jgi:hypothetical protein
LSVSMEWLWTLNVNPFKELKSCHDRLRSASKGIHFTKWAHQPQNQVPQQALLWYHFLTPLNWIGGSTMRHKALVRHLMIVSVFALIGCRNSATSPDPGVTSDGNTGNATPTSGANSAPAQDSGAQKAPESTLAHVFAPKPVVVKAGKEIVITADQSVSSKTSNSGDQFDASLAEPVVVGDKVVIPKGGQVQGERGNYRDS